MKIVKELSQSLDQMASWRQFYIKIRRLPTKKIILQTLFARSLKVLESMSIPGLVALALSVLSPERKNQQRKVGQSV